MSPLEIKRRIADKMKTKLPPRKPAPESFKAKAEELRRRLDAKEKPE